MDKAFACVAAAGVAMGVSAQFDQDYSGDITTPTSLGVFGVGVTTVSGVVNRATAGNVANRDIDIFTFDIAVGSELVAITYDSTNTNRPFVAIAEGDTFPVDPNTQSGGTTAFLGGFLPSPGGSDILDNLAAASNGGSGFSVPLGPGSYTFYAQQLGNNPVPYTLGFEVIPTPGGAAVLVLAGVSVLQRRRG